MTQRISASEPLVKHPDESILFGMDFTLWVNAAAMLESVDDVSAEGLTISEAAVNAATFPNGKGGTVAIGKGAQFRIAGGEADEDYLVEVTVTDTEGNTWVGVGTIQCRTA